MSELIGLTERTSEEAEGRKAQKYEEPTPETWEEKDMYTMSLQKCVFFFLRVCFWSKMFAVCARKAAFSEMRTQQKGTE